METLAIDIETYSDVSLPDCGVHRYTASDQFEMTEIHRLLTLHPERNCRPM